MLRISVLVSILMALAVTTAAEERFMVRVDEDEEAPQSLFGRLGLAVEMVRETDDGFLCFVSSDVLPPHVVEELLRAEASVQSVEMVRKLDVPELAANEEDSTKRRARSDMLVQDFVGSVGTQVDVRSWLTGYDSQPASSGLNLSRTHKRYGRGAGVIAIIDTGVDPNHPRLRARLERGFDFIHGRSGVPSEWSELDSETAGNLALSGARLAQSTVAVLDGFKPAALNQSTVAVLDRRATALLSDPRYQAFGHGTMVAGLILLVAPDARLMPLKAFRADGTGDTAAIAEAIYYAADNGADVINMSFSFEDFSLEVMRALNYATRRGVVAVAAAGNHGESVMVFPAAFANVTGVAGLSTNGKRSLISNYGEDLVSLAAPGEELVTTYPGGHYAVAFGTSFSSAVVSGAVSLMLGIDKDVSPDAAAAALAFGRESRGELGYGRLDLDKTLHWLRKQRKDDDD